MPFIKIDSERVSFTLEQIKPNGDSIYPRLEFYFKIASHGSKDIEISNIVTQSKIKSMETGVVYNIKYLNIENPLVKIYSNSESSFRAFLDIDYYGLKQIEKIREAGDVNLEIKTIFLAQILTDSTIKNEYSINIQHRLSKSDWVEKFLPILKYKSVFLVEIPKIEHKEFKSVIIYLNEAWKQKSMGQYDVVLTNCRKALEEIGKIVRKKKFEKIVQEGNKKLPDWNKFFDSKDQGDIFGNIIKKTFAFTSPGAHSGKGINKEDADYALLITHASINLAVKKRFNKFKVK